VDWRHCFVVETPEKEIIGCGKILPHDGGNWEVASLSVVKTYRGSGVALIGGKYIIDHAPRPLWGICERRALALYRRFGAVEVTDPAGMPRFVVKRLASYSRMLKMTHRQGSLAVVVVR
jgi:GNAT superfamily N-acetyltransferase